MKRRNFLVGLMALGALAGAGVRLPKKVEAEVEFDASPYLANKNTWYITTEHPSGLYSNTLVQGSDVSEASLQAILAEIRDSSERITVQPTKLIVHPDLRARAEYLLTHRPGFFERLWWSITSTMESLA